MGNLRNVLDDVKVDGIVDANKVINYVLYAIYAVKLPVLLIENVPVVMVEIGIAT